MIHRLTSLEKKVMIKLGLLFGGKSAEREVSIAGAKEVEKALRRDRYLIRRYDAATDLEQLIQDARSLDCVFILLHGRHGEDGTIQGLLELLGIPYQGSGVLGSALAMDKHMSKVIYRESGIDTPSWVCLYNPSELDVETALSVLGLPMIVKPCSQGSSIGVHKVVSEAEWDVAVEDADLE
jgi:D-alanine-D-alanine ligase